MNWRCLLLAGGVSLLGSGLPGCGGNDPAPATAVGKAANRMPAVTHEPCNENGAGAVNHDSNGDTKPEVITVMKDGRVGCTATYAGRSTADAASGAPRRVDMYEYFDASGKPRRREFAYGERGLINAIEIFENGVLRRREYDLAGTRRIDTIDYFDGSGPDPKTGKHRPVRRERDTNNDGQIDQWWTFGAGQYTVEMDRDADGKIEPEATMVMKDTGEVISVGGALTAQPPKPVPSAQPAKDAAPPEVSDSGATSPDAAVPNTKDGGA